MYRFSCWGRGGGRGSGEWSGGGGGGGFFFKNRRHSFVSIFMLGGGVMVRGGGGLFKKKIEDIHFYRFSCILVDIFAYYGSFAPKRHVDSYCRAFIIL